MIDVATIIYIWQNYGILGIIALILGLHMVYSRIVDNKKSKKIDEQNKKIEDLDREVKELREEVDQVHDNCHVDPEQIEKLYQKVEDLETQDNEMDGDLKALDARVEARFKALEDGQISMHKDIRLIMKHLMGTKE